ncbi:N-acetylglucosamine kinase-like BadF-type ATPase [Deinococcus metalli]|uniref:N-acetylglucosamine kinase-like BadF-type ATPase n=1 Tax=Deinococcus metalli TaxID=1141878 RepID=A0A7W8KEY7_9DEIO|nr:BadF/BadG/BcrA/BcrD ATPase family protein [Deinococcus metalli]MBB5375878.1 N-acetylglucosamine kinase-like BadF-type ATPase [Deinococcus metalli]
MSRPALLLGLDAGGSGTKWALARDGQTVASGVTLPFTAALLDTPAGAQALTALAAGLPGRPEAVHAGVAGLSAGSPRAAAVARELAGVLGLEPERVSVEGDLDLAYRAHLGGGEGVLLYAGTGSVAYHVSAGGAVTRAGGYGYRIGDDGGGFSLGRAALRVLTDDLDRGVVPSGALAAEVGVVTGGLDWDTLRTFVYGTPGAASVARLAPAVGKAADAGDVRAGALLTEAAGQLATLAQRVQARVGPLPVTATGGAFRVSPLLRAALTRELPGATVQQREHAEAAARYAAAHLSGS